MIDREKIIKAVDEAFDMYESEYGGTSFFDEKEWAENKRDALFLLKEQEAVEPTFKQDNDGIVWACGSCGAYMYHNGGISKAKEYAKYCRQCGKKVKWDA